MTEEDFKATPVYLGWSAGERTTFNGLHGAYRKLRTSVGPFVYIKRQMLAEAYGTTHVGTASKYQGHIELIENDQPPKRSPAAPRQPDSSEGPPPTIRIAFEGAGKALELALTAVLECRAAEGLALAETYQRVQREHLAAADARERALCERIAGLEADSTNAGEESCDLAATVYELREALQVVTSERVAAVARAEQAEHGQELAQVHRASAEVQIEALKASAVNLSAEVSRLVTEREGLEAAVAQAMDLRAENVGLTARADVMSDQISCLEKLMADLNDRHERDRASMEAAHNLALADERQRSAVREGELLAKIGPAEPTSQEEVG